jgi:hypothetical protein
MDRGSWCCRRVVLRAAAVTGITIDLVAEPP